MKKRKATTRSICKRLLAVILLIVLATAVLPAQKAEAAGSTMGKSRITECKNMAYGIRLKWTAAANADGYRVLRRAMSESKYVCIKTTKSLEFRDRNTEAGQFYYYKIRPYKIIDGTKVLGTRSAEQVVFRLVQAEITSAGAGKTGIKLEWKAHDRGSYQANIYYKVRRKESGESSFRTIASKLKKPAYTDETVKAGKEYTYQVRAYAPVITVSYSSWSEPITIGSETAG